MNSEFRVQNSEFRIAVAKRDIYEQSRADFIAKSRISLKEARESHYWLRVLEKSELIDATRLHGLVNEANEIVAVLTTIVKNATTPQKAAPP